MLATNTWNAYNPWGGRSLYTGGRQVSFRRPFARGMLCRPEVDRDDRKSRPTRWAEDPDVNGDRFQEYRTAHAYPAAIGSSGWFSHERRFVEWAEAAGYQFDMCISTDLDDDSSIADGYDLIIDVGHDEYWSAGQRATIEAHVRRGGHLASFSGNTCFWQVRVDDEPGHGGTPGAEGDLGGDRADRPAHGCDDDPVESCRGDVATDDQHRNVEWRRAWHSLACSTLWRLICSPSSMPSAPSWSSRAPVATG